MAKEDKILDKVVFTDSEMKDWLKQQQKKWLSILRKGTLKQKLDMIPFFSGMVYAIIKAVEKEAV